MDMTTVVDAFMTRIQRIEEQLSFGAITKDERNNKIIAHALEMLNDAEGVKS